MPKIFAIASNITSGLGLDTAAHWRAATTGTIGIKRFEDAAFGATPFMASRIDPAQWQVISQQTSSGKNLYPFEQLAFYSARKALQDIEDIDLNQTIFILSTTKGNIELLGKVADEQLLLHCSAAKIAACLGISNKPLIISHACVSGVVALQYGMEILRSGRYKHAIVTGCDRFSRFVLSGFQSFQAVSDKPCRPFDAARKGITLGEAASTIILSADYPDSSLGELVGGATSNDANHISGPSRTGEELAMAINGALEEAGISASQIGMVSAHGTATIFNDEMEAKAFDIAALTAPVHSFKGYIGHTLGAGGVLESAMVLESILHQEVIPSAGFSDSGVSKPINISQTLQQAQIEYGLKTASGFGGCNAAVIWKKVS